MQSPISQELPPMMPDIYSYTKMDYTSSQTQMFRSTHSLQWRHNRRERVLNHQPYHCLRNRLFRRRSKKTSKLRVTGLCVGNPPVTGEFPAQLVSNAKMFPFNDVIMCGLILVDVGSDNGLLPDSTKPLS